MLANAKGQCLLGVILIRHDCWDDETVLRHELQHLEQMKNYSPIGLCLILGWHYMVGLVKREPFMEIYHNHPIEIDARKAMFKTDPLPKIWNVR